MADILRLTTLPFALYFEFEHNSDKGKTTLSASMNTSQTSSKIRNSHGQGNNCLGCLSHSLLLNILLHFSHSCLVRSIDDDFFDLIKSEVKVVTFTDIKAYLKMYYLPNV